jgi:hypothetical protein
MQFDIRTVRYSVKITVMTVMPLLAVSLLTIPAQSQSAPRPGVQEILSMNVPSYSVNARNLLQAAAQIASDFNLPMGIEWQGDPNTKQSISYEWKNVSLQKIVYDLPTFDLRYQVDVSDGVVHLWSEALADDVRNPLNITLPTFSATNIYAGKALFNLQDQMNSLIFPTQKRKGSGCAGSYAAGAGDAIVTVSMDGATARQILDTLVVKSSFVMWLAVFPDQQPTSGYLKTKPPGRATTDRQQPDIDLVTRYHDPVTDSYRGDWKIGLNRK